jgi:hypothetical protein
VGLWSFEFGGSPKARFGQKSIFLGKLLLYFVNRPSAEFCLYFIHISFFFRSLN